MAKEKSTPHRSISAVQCIPIIFLLSWANLVNCGAIPSPAVCKITSYNLNALLEWEPLHLNMTPFDNSETAVTYSVKYWCFDWTDGRSTWEDMPNCTHITKTSCRLVKMDVHIRNSYALQAEIGNHSSNFEDGRIDYSPHFDEMLLAPPFTLSVNGSEVTIHIPDPPRVLWSPTLLWDLLEEEHLEYKVKYWIKKQENVKQSNVLVFPLSAELQTIKFSVMKLEKEESVCVSLQLKSMYFDSANFSDSVCSNTSETMKMEVSSRTRSTALLTLLIVLGISCLAVLLSILVLVYKKIMKFMKLEADETMTEAMAYMLDGHPPFAPSAAVDLENVTKFNPCRDRDSRCDEVDNIVKDLDSTETNSPTDSTNHLSSNDYIVASGDTTKLSVGYDVTNEIASSRIPRIVIHPDTSPADYLKDINDYVLKVPDSPDSGLDMQDFF